QLCCVVASSPLPADRTQVGLVVQPEVLKGGEQASLQRFPEPQLDDGPSIEPDTNVESVGALRCRRETEEHLRVDVTQEVGVGIGLFAGVVELVDDDHVESVGSEVASKV